MSERTEAQAPPTQEQAAEAHALLGRFYRAKEAECRYEADKLTYEAIAYNHEQTALNLRGEQ